MNSARQSSVFLLLTLALTVGYCVQLRVLTNLAVRGQPNKPDLGEQKLVVNSNNRFIYPSSQVPQYNVFTLPPLFYSRNFLEVVSENYIYPIVLIDQRPNKPTTYQLVHPFTRQIIEQLSEPLYLRPLDRLQHLTQDQPFSITSFLFSGTGLFVLGGAFIYMCYKTVMPKLEEAQMAPEGAQ